jgi:GDPmannose 4,6-dehydratase
VKKYKPDYIFHFAAISTTQHSALFENHNAISTGTINVLEAAKNHSPNSRVFLSGSAMQFKNEGLPISKKDIYDISKKSDIIVHISLLLFVQIFQGQVAYLGFQ